MGAEAIIGGTLGLGSMIMNKRSADKQAKTIAAEGAANRALIREFGSPLEVRGGVSPINATVSADPKLQYMINPAIAPANLQELGATSQEVINANKQYVGDLQRARGAMEQQAVQGIDPETQRLIMRNVKEQAGQQVKAGLQQTQAGLIAGQAGGGVAQQRQDEIIGAGAQMVGNQQYNLALQSIAAKQEAIDKLIGLGQTEKANALQNQQLEESRTLTNNAIRDTLRNQDIQNINSFNNLILQMKNISMQQAGQLLDVSRQTTADLLQTSAQYNNMVSSTINNLTDMGMQIWKFNALKSLNNKGASSVGQSNNIGWNNTPTVNSFYEAPPTNINI